MTKRDPEYDRFGPWVIEISALDPPPPLFLPYLTRAEEPLLSLKIPRKIDRRDAQAGMNLYDYLITLYEEDLVILERVGDDVHSKTFFYRDIQHLRLGENLLKGTLHLSMVDKDYDLRFNTVSSAIMQRLVDLIRHRYSSGDTPAVIDEAPEFAEDRLSFYFTRLLADERKHHPAFGVLAAQLETAVGAYETAAYRKILLGIISKQLLEALHLSDGREMKIINRGKTYKYRGQNVYATERCYLPTANITAVTWQKDAQNAALINLILETGGGQVAYAFLADNPGLPGYERFLSAVTARPQKKLGVKGGDYAR